MEHIHKGFKDKTATEVVRYPEVHMVFGAHVERQGIQSELFA